MVQYHTDIFVHMLIFIIESHDEIDVSFWWKSLDVSHWTRVMKRRNTSNVYLLEMLCHLWKCHFVNGYQEAKLAQCAIALYQNFYLVSYSWKREHENNFLLRIGLFCAKCHQWNIILQFYYHHENFRLIIFACGIVQNQSLEAWQVAAEGEPETFWSAFDPWAAGPTSFEHIAGGSVAKSWADVCIGEPLSELASSQGAVA